MCKPRSGWDGVNVLCPYYIHQTALSITCEGAEPDEEIRRRFKTPADCSNCLQEYCCSKYTSCPHYKLADKKY